MGIEIIAALMDSGFCQQNIFIFGNKMLVARSFSSFSITIMLGLYHYYHVRPHINIMLGHILTLLVEHFHTIYHVKHSLMNQLQYALQST